MTGPDTRVREFVSRIHELAIADGTRAWLDAMFDIGSLEASAAGGAWPDTTLIARAHCGCGELSDGRLTGRWTAVGGARYADWFVLPARHTALCRVLVPRDCVAVGIEPRGAGLAEVAAFDVVVDPGHVLLGDGATASLLTATGAAAAVLGSTQGLWRRHVGQLRSHLAAYHGGTTADSDAAQVARAASDIDAAELQLLESATAEASLEDTVWVCRQVVARARAAADRLLEHSRHALDADDPVTQRWCEVDVGARVAVRLFDDLSASLR
ncbi:hypothetical protein [Mycobacterium sp. PSTR-4-N]|uniref:hypothetical protein n=1 Tax=Mycobacterium sp. PSTR-4-N TaxID=2917745 RepID=UPI001F152526|nr:hypothetical protein [Mycobacterium sp. PSTR-4-N]MCG7595976.1 hypothetical protein [Mycobacterium sp. PSTR-4-N]